MGQGLLGRRVALAVTAAGLVAALAGAAGFALFTSTAVAQTDTFAAGTVTIGSPGQFTCTISNLEPGDSTMGYPDDLGAQNVPPCVYTVEYSGSLPAWVAIDTTVSSSANAPSSQCSGVQGTVAACRPLYNPGDPNSLNLMLCGAELPQGLAAAQRTAFEQDVCRDTGSPVGYGIGPNQTLTYNVAYDYDTTRVYDVCTGNATVDPAICSDGGTGAVLNGWTYVFTLDFFLPLTAGNAYQGGSASVTLTVHAVQASNNPLSVTCNPINDPYRNDYFTYLGKRYQGIGFVYPPPAQPQNGWHQSPGGAACPRLQAFYHPYS